MLTNLTQMILQEYISYGKAERRKAKNGYQISTAYQRIVDNLQAFNLAATRQEVKDTISNARKKVKN